MSPMKKLKMFLISRLNRKSASTRAQELIRPNRWSTLNKRQKSPRSMKLIELKLRANRFPPVSLQLVWINRKRTQLLKKSSTSLMVAGSARPVKITTFSGAKSAIAVKSRSQNRI